MDKRMDRNVILLLGILVTLIGCTLAPTYTRPEAPVPPDWPTGPAYPASQAAEAPDVSALAWQGFFTDTALQQLIAAALENNRDLRIAALNVQRARAVYGIQRAALFPSLDAVANGNKHRVPADISSSGESYTAEQYDVNLGVYAWEIDLFGRLRSLKEQALEAYLATEEARRGVQILLVSSVGQTYLTLAADREALKLTQQTLEAQKKSYDLIKRRYDVGLATLLDLNYAQTQVDAARRDRAIYIQRVAQDENALDLLVGTPSPLSRALLPEDLAGVEPLQTLDAGLSSEVLLVRPDILQAEHVLKGTYANIGAARAALFPRISLTTTAGTASAELSGLFAAGSGTWLFAPQIAMPVFDARLWSALEVTKAEQEIALAQYEKAIQTAFKEVADTLAVQGTVDEQLAAQQSLVRATAETYRLSEARYTKGIDNYLGVLVAQRSLFAAQQGLVALNLAKRANQVRLYEVLGGGTQ
jgi:outer membrane protein, multidrug efflux system